MTDTLDPAHITAVLGAQFDAFAAVVSRLDENRWRTPSPLPGWTVFDVVAHVVGTESMLLGEQPPAADPDRPDPEMNTLAHVRNDIGAMNELWIHRMRSWSGKDLLRRYVEVTDRRRKALNEMTAEQWAAPSASPIGQVPYARFMQVRVFDIWMHELDIADALGISVDEGGVRGETAFAEFSWSLPRVVAKLGKAPVGSRVRFELTGPLARTLNIAVEERARYVDSFDESPTVTITLDSGLLIRLGGGRVDPAEHLPRIEFTGDAELGRRIVTNMSFLF